MSRLSVILRNDVVMSQIEPLEGMKVGFFASRVRNRATGYHASVRITLNRELLAGDLLNFEKNSQRKTLAGDAHGMMPQALKDAYGKLFLKRDLDEFCEQILPVWSSAYQAQLVAGNPDHKTEWYCPPLVMQDAATIMFGSRGGGKSMTAMTAAISMQHGISNIWNPIEIANTLYVNIERGQRSMESRIARINMALGLSAREPLLMINARGQSLDQIYDTARKSIRKHEVQAVFFDSISRTGAGNLNDNEPANLVMDTLSALCPTWVAIAHLSSPDGGKPKVFGSQRFENAADLVVRLSGDSSQENKVGVSLEIIKANDAELGQQHVISYGFNGHGLMSITASSLREHPDLDQKTLSNPEKIEMYISNTAETSATASEISNALDIDQSNVSKILIRHSQRFVRLPKDGKEQPYGLASHAEERR